MSELDIRPDALMKNAGDVEINVLLHLRSGLCIDYNSPKLKAIVSPRKDSYSNMMEKKDEWSVLLHALTPELIGPLRDRKLAFRGYS